MIINKPFGVYQIIRGILHIFISTSIRRHFIGGAGLADNEMQTKPLNMYMVNQCEGFDLVHLGKLQKPISNHAGCGRPWLAKDIKDFHILIECRI